MATMNLADPELELVDPTPNVHMLFIQFDKVFFWTKLASRVIVRWSKRMYTCAGICTYEGGGGLCDIGLSEPLLRLRPRKDLVETLLHEMIHAFLFVTNRDQDRDGHGPNFQAHMHRINRAAGLNITIYHDFHDEVRLYQTHWWRCNGRCQTLRPRFGIVRRAMNRAPGPADYWWHAHQKQCGGTFIKIKEPEKKKPGRKATTKGNTNNTKKNVTGKAADDITKYINNTGNTNKIMTGSNNGKKPVLKDTNKIPKTNNANSIVGKQPDDVKPPQRAIPVFTGNGNIINSNINTHISDSRNVTEQVRNIWANKQIPAAINKTPIKQRQTSHSDKHPGNLVMESNTKKHKAEAADIQTPPAKIKKIDDYFKTNASSVLKDLYGEDFKLTQTDANSKLVAVSVKEKLVDCPVCRAKVDSKEINRHLDECLNKDIIEQLSQMDQEATQPAQTNDDRNHLKEIVGHVPPIPPFNGQQANTHPPPQIVKSTNNNIVNVPDLNCAAQRDVIANDNHTIRKERRKTHTPIIVPGDIDLDTYLRQIAKPIYNKQMSASNNSRKSDTFVTKGRGDEPFASGLIPDTKICENIQIKSEKGTGSDSNQSKQPVQVIDITSEPGPSGGGGGGGGGGGAGGSRECPCCGDTLCGDVAEHLDECSVLNDTVVTEDDDCAGTSLADSDAPHTSGTELPQPNTSGTNSLEVGDSSTEWPCPCCMKMVEHAAMNQHLDLCLGLCT